MIQLHIVPTELVHSVWEKVSLFITASYEESNKDCTPEQLKMLIARGEQTLFVGVEDEQIVGAMTVEIINYPNVRAGFITALGGKAVVDQELFAQVEEWLRANGASKVYAYAKPAQARLYQQKAGFEPARYVVEKAL